MRFTNTEFIKSMGSMENIDDFFASEKIERSICFLGRSNVGKSSLINALFGKKLARVSNTPGRTQLVNIFKNPESNMHIFDLPGYGYAKVSKAMKKDWVQLMHTFFQNYPVEKPVFWVQDARHPWSTTDIELADYLRGFGFLKAFIVFNKFDKLKTQKDKAAFKAKVDESFKLFPVFKTISASATSKINLEEIELQIEENF